MSDQEVYREICNSYRAIDDFRMKLLGFLPLASGGLLALLVNPDLLLGKDGAASTPSSLAPAIATLGFVVTLGLFALEIFGIRKCTALIAVGASLETKAGSVGHGQFADRPPGVLGFIAEPLAAGIIYPAVLATWIYFVLHLARRECAAMLAIFVFAAFFLLSLGYIVWLSVSERSRLRESLGLVDDLR